MIRVDDGNGVPVQCRKAYSSRQEARVKWLLWQRMVGRVCSTRHDIHIHRARQLCQAHVHVPAKRNMSCGDCSTIRWLQDNHTTKIGTNPYWPSVLHTDRQYAISYTAGQQKSRSALKAGADDILDGHKGGCLLPLLGLRGSLHKGLHAVQQTACYHRSHDLQ